MFESSDDCDFTPSISSKLASLFGNSFDSSDSTNSLTYTAPKQPLPTKTAKEIGVGDLSRSKLQSTLLIAKAVNLWKLVDKDYTPLGKYGLALIGSTDLTTFEIIAYRETHNIHVRAQVNDSFKFYNQKDNFSSFYDSEYQNWLVKFENEDQNEFCIKLETHGAKVITSKENTPEEKTPISYRPDLLPKPAISSDRSTDEQLSDDSGSQKRANILNRMAKMGQQILPQPLLKGTSSDLSDSETDESMKNRKILMRKVKKSSEIPSTSAVENNLQDPVISQNYFQSQVVPASSSFSGQNFSNMTAAHTVPVIYQPIGYDNFNQYLVAQNTDLRMSLAQISTKLDNVLTLKENPSEHSHLLSSKLKALELKCENLQNTLEQREKLYCDLEVKYENLSKLESQVNEKRDIINKLQSEVSQEKLNLIKAEEKLTGIEQLNIELEESRDVVRNHQKTINIQQLKLKDFEEFYEQNKDNQKHHETVVDELNNTVKILKLKLKDFEEYHKAKETERKTQKNCEKINNLSDMVKKHMNDMYQSVLNSFVEENSYTFPEIQNNIAQNLKETTFRIIEDLKINYNPDEQPKFEF